MDERGGDVLITVTPGTFLCPTREPVTFRLQWTFPRPIVGLRPGDLIPINVQLVVGSSRTCPGAVAFRSFVDARGSDYGGLGWVPPNLANQFWPNFTAGADPAPPGTRYRYYAGGAESGQAVLRVTQATPGSSAPQGGYFGLVFNSSATRGGGDTVSFVYPYRYSGDGPAVGDQATQDMMRRAGRDARFGPAIAGSLGAQVEWSPAWELRWMDFSFSNGRRVRIYHATSKANRAIRYTIFWDPDLGTWTNWEQAA
jgi:hypothetical protein